VSPTVIDAVFAYAHFFGIGCLVAVLAMETAMLRGDLRPAIFERLAKLDLGLGVSAVLILVAGAGRVGMGLKGAAYYMGNPAPDALHRTRLFIKAEWLLLALNPLAAVVMTRFY
jgi:uncharacterized membrane protein